MQLLTRQRNNAKLNKSSSTGYEAVGLFLHPSISLCPHATKECLAACLNTAGRAAVFPSILQARRRKSDWYRRDRDGFEAQLRLELQAAQRRADRRGKTLAIRLNGTSDIVWPESLYQEFPRAQFYDYTKNPGIHSSGNHHVTFSHSGENLPECLRRLQSGENVAVVFDSGNFPSTWHGYRVVSGEQSDLRFLDPLGVVVALKAKGRAKAANVGGFIQISKRS